MRLTSSQAAQLVKLGKGLSLPKSRLSKALLRPLQEAGAVHLEKSGASYLVRGIPAKLASFVEQYWGVRDLKRLASASPESRSREELVKIAGDSKALPSNPLQGIFIRSFGNCSLGDQALASTPSGSAIFLSKTELPRLMVSAPSLIGIENVECFLKFEKCLPHFPALKQENIALVWRWTWGVAWQCWLRDFDGAFLYFPDYDPAGLRIFSSQVLRYRANARLLLPENLDGLLKSGKPDLYMRQEFLLRAMPSHPDIEFVTKRLQVARKGLEQESLLT